MKTQRRQLKSTVRNAWIDGKRPHFPAYRWVWSETGKLL